MVSVFARASAPRWLPCIPKTESTHKTASPLYGWVNLHPGFLSLRPLPAPALSFPSLLCAGTFRVRALGVEGEPAKFEAFKSRAVGHT